MRRKPCLHIAFEAPWPTFDLKLDRAIGTPRGRNNSSSHPLDAGITIHGVRGLETAAVRASGGNQSPSWPPWLSAVECASWRCPEGRASVNI